MNRYLVFSQYGIATPNFLWINRMELQMRKSKMFYFKDFNESSVLF